MKFDDEIISEYEDKSDYKVAKKNVLNPIVQKKIETKNDGWVDDDWNLDEDE